MADRKVQTKYFPADFDPARLPRAKKSKDNQFHLRSMIPFTVRCLKCGTYMFKDRKFNIRMEPVEDEEYLGIRIWRLYFRCIECLAEFTLKTDPKTADYVVEQGAHRTTAHRNKRADDEVLEDEEEEEEEDAFAALERRTKESKRQMETMTMLEELKARNMKHVFLNPDDLLRTYQKPAEGGAADLDGEASDKPRLTAEEAIEAAKAFQNKREEKRQKLHRVSDGVSALDDLSDKLGLAGAALLPSLPEQRADGGAATAGAAPSAAAASATSAPPSRPGLGLLGRGRKRPRPAASTAAAAPAAAAAAAAAPVLVQGGQSQGPAHASPPVPAAAEAKRQKPESVGALVGGYASSSSDE